MSSRQREGVGRGGEEGRELVRGERQREREGGRE